MSRYGTVGYDVGRVGRWSRFGYGLLVAVGATASTLLSPGRTAELGSFLLQVALFFGAITLVYLGVYWLLGERVFARANPWLNTLILVGPALALSWWNLTLRPVLGVALPAPLTLAMLIYIGLSLVLEAWIRYGGCEVVALPILVFRRRYVTYCVPVVLVDTAERGWVESAGLQRTVWIALGLAALVTILLAILGVQPLLSGLALVVLAALVGVLAMLDRRRATRPRRRGRPPRRSSDMGRAAA
jgi:hypothetical protein